MRNIYYYHYQPPQKPFLSGKRFRRLLIIELLTLVVMIGIMTFIPSNDGSIISGYVIEKNGQNKPIITWAASEYGWKSAEEIPDPEGWFVLVQRGNKYQRFRLTREQYEQVGINAFIWQFGPLTLWVNR